VLSTKKNLLHCVERRYVHHRKVQDITGSESLLKETLAILRLKDVMQRIGLSRSTIYQRMSEGTFPESISLGDRAIGWLESDIDAWLRQQIAASRGRVA
jgi:Predicted transcriptional regulator